MQVRPLLCFFKAVGLTIETSQVFETCEVLSYNGITGNIFYLITHESIFDRSTLSRNMKIALPFIVILLSSLTFFHCNESLPVYTAPPDVLRASVTAINSPTDTVNYRMFDENNPNLAAVRILTPPFGFEVNVTNIYSETIQDDADVQGTLELTWVDKTENKASIPLQLTGITGSQYDPATNLITLNPGDSLKLRTYWDFKLITKDWAFTKQQAVDGPWINGNGNFYRFHLPMEFRARISVKIFRSLSFTETISQNTVTVNFKGLIIAPP